VTHQNLVNFGETELNLSALEQLVEKYQTIAICDSLLVLRGFMTGNQTLLQVIQQLENRISVQGLDCLKPGQPTGCYARPRIIEVAMALNRLRTFKARNPSQ